MDFKELIKRISPKIKGIIHKLPKNFNSFDGNDLYEEAIAQLWINYRDGKLFDKTDSYIVQGCYFYLKNYIRRFKEKATLVSINYAVNENGDELQDIFLSKEDDPQSDSEGKDIDTLMEEVFNSDLTRKEKEVVFYYLQGWTTREIGERLGISHVSVVKLEEKIREKCKKVKNSFPR